MKFELNEEKRFLYRVAGLAIHDDKILLCHGDGHRTYWTLPGGSCEFFEDAASCVEREFLEEVGANVETDQLVILAENFFKFRNSQAHAIELYFLLKNLDTKLIENQNKTIVGFEDFDTDGQNHILKFRWIPIDQIDSYDIRPAFLKEYLKTKEYVFKHFVQRD